MIRQKRRVYLDYAATTPLDAGVERAMRPFYSSAFGNPGSVHWFGQQASAAVFGARQMIARALGADYKEIIFTGSATEANNLALRGVLVCALQNQRRLSPAESRASALAPMLRPRSETKPSGLRDVLQDTTLAHPLKIITSAIEHESVLKTARDLENNGLEVVYIPVDREGAINLKKLEAALDERTILVSIQYANSEMGAIQPIQEIGKIISNFRGQKKYPLFHTDATQAFQFLKCDVNELEVDMLTLSAHKIYGPKGIGALYVRHSDLLSSQITGGGQEQGFRSGTENVPAIVGFGKAVEITERVRNKESGRLKKLRDQLWDGLQKIVPDVALNGSVTERLPNNLNVYFPGRSAQDLCIELDLGGLSVSPGTACSSRTTQPSYVIEALEQGGDRPSSSIRFSLGRPTTAADIDAALTILKQRFKK